MCGRLRLDARLMHARLFFAITGDVSFFKAWIRVSRSVRISRTAAHKDAIDTSASMYVWLMSDWVVATTLASLPCQLASFSICAFCPTKAMAAFASFGGDSPIACAGSGGIGVEGSGIGVCGGFIAVLMTRCA